MGSAIERRGHVNLALVALDLAQVARREAGIALDPDLGSCARSRGREVVDNSHLHGMVGEEHREPRAQDLSGFLSAQRGPIYRGQRRGEASDDLLEVTGEIKVGRALIRRQASRATVELYRMVIEFPAADALEHTRRGRHRHAGLAQKPFDLVFAA